MLSLIVLFWWVWEYLLNGIQLLFSSRWTQGSAIPNLRFLIYLVWMWFWHPEGTQGSTWIPFLLLCFSLVLCEELLQEIWCKCLMCHYIKVRPDSDVRGEKRKWVGGCQGSNFHNRRVWITPTTPPGGPAVNSGSDHARLHGSHHSQSTLDLHRTTCQLVISQLHHQSQQNSSWDSWPCRVGKIHYCGSTKQVRSHSPRW